MILTRRWLLHSPHSRGRRQGSLPRTPITPSRETAAMARTAAAVAPAAAKATGRIYAANRSATAQRERCHQFYTLQRDSSRLDSDSSTNLCLPSRSDPIISPLFQELLDLEFYNAVALVSREVLRVLFGDCYKSGCAIHVDRGIDPNESSPPAVRMSSTAAAELLGDDHSGTSLETPLRPDAFVLSDEEKIAAIEPLFGQVPCAFTPLRVRRSSPPVYRPPSRAAPPLHPAA